MSKINHCEHGGGLTKQQGELLDEDGRNIGQVENLMEAFECGKLWDLLHQNVMLLRLWGFSVSKGNVAANCKLNWLDENFAGKMDKRVSTSTDWLVEWHDVAMDHLLDAVDLFSLVLSDNQRLPVVTQTLQYGPDHLIKFNLLQQCLEVVLKLACNFELDKATKTLIVRVLDNLTSKKKELKEEYCSAACKVNFENYAWRNLISEFLENMITVHVRLLQARGVQTCNECMCASV